MNSQKICIFCKRTVNVLFDKDRYLCSICKKDIGRAPKGPEPGSNGKNDKPFRIILGSELKEEQIEKVLLETLDLDDRGYAEEADKGCFLGKLDETPDYTIEKVLRRYKINPDITFLVIDNATNKVIAYADVVPVTEKWYKNLLTGEYYDADIPEKAIIPIDEMKDTDCYIYFESIVIDKAYKQKNWKTAVMALDGLRMKIMDQFVELSKQGIYYNAMVADAWTVSGENFCTSFGMKFIKQSKHKTPIYNVSLIPPGFRKHRAPELYNIYKKRYEEYQDEYDENFKNIQKFIEKVMS